MDMGAFMNIKINELLYRVRKRPLELRDDVGVPHHHISRHC